MNKSLLHKLTIRIAKADELAKVGEQLSQAAHRILNHSVNVPGYSERVDAIVEARKEWDRALITYTNSILL